MLSDEYVNKVINGTMKINKYVSYKEFNSNQLDRLQKFYGEWQYLSTCEAAVWLGVSLRTIYRMIVSDRIAYIRLVEPYGHYRIDVNKTIELLNK